MCIRDSPTEVLDWAVGVGCANHDVQNAIKWSLACLVDTGVVVRNLFISVAALRNGFNYLHAHAASFVAEKLQLSHQ
eukprot:8182968-Lingulodinium_polyedra.AAC.1